MSFSISREQVIRRLRDAGWKFQRQADRVEIHKKGVQRVNVQRRDKLPEMYVRILLKQAGLSAEEIEAFIRDAVKS